MLNATLLAAEQSDDIFLALGYSNPRYRLRLHESTRTARSPLVAAGVAVLDAP